MQDRTSANSMKVLLQRTAGPSIWVMSAGRDPAVAAAHVRFAPKTTVANQNVIRRFVPLADIGRRRPPVGVRWFLTFARRRLFARVTGRLHVPDLLDELVQVLSRRVLQRWEVDVGL